MAGDFSARFVDATAEERYAHIVIHSYGLKTIIHQRLYGLGWLKFGRKPARANINWVREFYAHNASGDKEIVHVRGRMVPADADTLKKILDLPEGQPNIYDHINALEDINFNAIKDVLCQPGTKWNTTGRNPRAINRPNLLSKAKLWNTILKRNLLPTPQNQTVDCKGLLSAANMECRPTAMTITLTSAWAGIASTNIDVADYMPIQVAMPTPAQSEHTEAPAPAVNLETPAGSAPATPPAEPHGSPSVATVAEGSFAAKPTPPAPPAEPQPSPAHSTEVLPLYIMQLRNQIQRIEARQIEFITKSKVFETTLLQFLYDNFPNVKFQPESTAPVAPSAANSAATPSAKIGETEEIHYSSNAELDAFDWHTAYETQPPTAPASSPAPPADIAESSSSRKRKAPTVRVIREDTPIDLTTNPLAAANPPAQPTPAKRRRYHNIILSDSKDDEDNSNNSNDDPASSKSLAFYLFILMLIVSCIFTCLVYVSCVENNASLQFGGMLS
ncbi:hypothetical protein V6N11_008373 [Hibiscus sabdariffa]|uniref:Putative plant transposon protein domain-containing protein n=1 Tax=Hibiscus sabdariffa TaxID=183260 RepID=A0ABR2NMP7_9ROSI